MVYNGRCYLHVMGGRVLDDKHPTIYNYQLRSRVMSRWQDCHGDEDFDYSLTKHEIDEALADERGDDEWLEEQE